MQRPDHPCPDHPGKEMQLTDTQKRPGSTWRFYRCGCGMTDMTINELIPPKKTIPIPGKYKSRQRTRA